MMSKSFILLLHLLLAFSWQSEKENSSYFCHAFVVPSVNSYSRYYSPSKKNDVIPNNNFRKASVRKKDAFNNKRTPIILLGSNNQEAPLLNKNNNNYSNNNNNTQKSLSSVQAIIENENTNENLENDTLVSSELLPTVKDEKDFSVLKISTTATDDYGDVEGVTRKEDKKNWMSYSNLDMDNPRVEIVSGFLVLVSSLLAALTTLPSLDTNYLKILNNAEDLITVLFATEFILRWISYYNKTNEEEKRNVLKYLWQPLSLVDLTSIWLPLVLSVMHIETSKAALVNLRLLRILRLQRVLESEENFSNFIMATLPGMSTDGVRPYQLQLARVLLSIFTLLSISTGFIYSAEHTVNPQIPDYFTALYFGLTTLTTVGFGDIAPVTFQGRLIVMGSILAGVTIIPAQAANFVQALLDFQTERRVALEQAAVATKRKEEEEMKLQEDLNEKKKKKSKSCFANFEIVQVEICPKCQAREHNKDAIYCYKCGQKFF